MWFFYRIRQLEKPVTDMSKEELAENFRPEIIEIIDEGRKRKAYRKGSVGANTINAILNILVENFIRVFTLTTYLIK